ncbi:hypothetical protein BsWGS_06837 [Bradybaena similaris]
MAVSGKDSTSAQPRSGISVTVVKVMCGSPAGMGQLMKYFESQSRRLDRQTFQSYPSLNPDFESSIKFNGVPILPPAITSSRRDELHQYKKDAVLLEKRLKARHRRELLAKADSLVSQSKVCFPRTPSRQTARQLNFDSEGRDEPGSYSHQHDRFSGAHTFSTIAEAGTVNDSDDFGLQTLDSVNSDFMSLGSGFSPKVFSGLALTSVKEQKISYDLDRLSKALNVQDLTSLSGSDLSDTVDLTQTQDYRSIQTARDGNSSPNTVSAEGRSISQRSPYDSVSHSASSHQDAHSMGVRELLQSAKQSLESGKVITGDTVSSGFIEKADLTNPEQSHNSHSSSPGSGVVNVPADGQWSNRSSPKSQKSGVHFAPFVTEYKNTSTRAEQPTVIKKKMSPDHEIAFKPSHEDNAVVPIILDPSECRRRSLLSHKVFDFDSSMGLMDKVYPDSSPSPATPPFSNSGHVPFQLYGRSELSSSDKENDVTQLYTTVQHGGRMRSVEPANISGHSLEDRVSSESLGHESRQQQICVDKMIGNSGTTSADDTVGGKVTKNSAPRSHGGPSVVREAGMSSDSLVSASNSATTSDTISVTDSSTFIVKSANLDVVSINKTLISDFQASTRSNTLTNTSGSGSSTIRDELPRDVPVVGVNIVNSDLHSVIAQPGACQDKPECDGLKTIKEIQPCLSDSPKKLNIDTSVRESDTQENVATPSRNICRNSYTLSEPSPALIQAHGRPDKTSVKEKKDEQKATVKTDVSIPHIKQQSAADQIPPNRLQTTSKNTVAPEADVKASLLSDAEKEGKAEHINKYLNQVQLQNSANLAGQSWNTQYMPDDIEDDEETQPVSAATDEDCHTSVLDVLRSIVESQGSLETHTVAELLDLHQQQMNEKRQSLIRQQQREMEELFIQQRRQMMLLDAEIKAVQQQGQEQKQFLIENAPENIKVKSKTQNGEYSPVQTGNFDSSDAKHWQRKPKPMAETLVNVPGSSQAHVFSQSSSDMHSTSIRLKPKSNSEMDAKSEKSEQMKAKSNYQSKKMNVMHSSPNSTNDDSQTSVKNAVGDHFYSSSASGVRVVSRIPELSPSVTPPYLRHPLVMRSPQKYTSRHRNDRVVVPHEAYLPEMQIKFDKLTAAAKGFLTRCLMRSDKVQKLIKTIRDTREFAFSFQTETPIKKGVFTSQDKVLLERIIAQLQAALLDIHEIFFEMPITDRLILIEQTRASEQEKRAKASARDSMRESMPKISQATLKALERKRKSREGGPSADMTAARPRTAPPRTSSPQQESHTDGRALKPLQSHSHISPILSDANRGPLDLGKERQLIQPKRIVAMPSRPASALVANNTDSQKRGSQKLSVVTNKPVLKSKPAASKPTNRQVKSWR